MNSPQIIANLIQIILYAAHSKHWLVNTLQVYHYLMRSERGYSSQSGNIEHAGVLKPSELPSKNTLSDISFNQCP